MSGKKKPAGSFLAKMARGRIQVPDSTTKVRFAEAVAAKPERIKRVVLLLQAAAALSDTLRTIAADLAMAALPTLGVGQWPEALDTSGFHEFVSDWILRSSKRPLKQRDLDVLSLLLHLGVHHHIVDTSSAFTLVALAVNKPKSPRGQSKQPPTRPTSILDILLASQANAQVLSALVACYDAARAESDRLKRELDALSSNVEELRAQLTDQRLREDGLRHEIASLQEQGAAQQAAIGELERRLVEIEDGYKHKLYELSGRVRGVLEGQLTRYVQTALNAARAEPPWLHAVEERLEDALVLIRKEIAWLQPSA